MQFFGVLGVERQEVGTGLLQPQFLPEGPTFPTIWFLAGRACWQVVQEQSEGPLLGISLCIICKFERLYHAHVNHDSFWT